jgi:2'-5' RNA ligase
MDVIAKQQAAIETLLRNQENATVIPIRDSFENDDRTSLGIFATIPDSIAAEIARVQSALRMVAPHFHYAPPESLHLTVQNVRTIAKPPTFTSDDARCVADIVRQVSEHHPTQQVKVHGIIQLPTSVLITVFYPEPMQRLIAELSENLTRIGLPDDKRYVDATTRFGNITICRFTAPPTAEFSNAVATFRQHNAGEFQIPSLTVASTNAVFDLAFTEYFGTFELGSSVG